MSDELLGMPGRDMQMNSQAFSPKNDIKFFVSDAPQVQETIFDKTC
jgi:hypothetical protein